MPSLGFLASKTFNFLTGAIPGVSASRAATQQINQKKAELQKRTATLPRSPQVTAVNKQIQMINPPTDAATRVRDFTVAAIRAPIRAAATVGKSVADVTNPALGLPKGPEIKTTNNRALKFILGKEPIKSIQQREAETQKSLGKSRFKGVAAPLAFLGTAASVGLDITPFGGGKGIKSGLEQLAKATTEAEVRRIMKGTPQQIIDRVAPAVARTKDPNVINTIIQRASAPRTGPIVAPVPVNDVLPSARQGTKQIANDPVSKVVESLRGIDAGPGIESLQAQQAQLYSAARRERLAKSVQAGSNLSGRQATFAQLGALKGELPKVDSQALVEHLRNKVTPEDVNSILDTVRSSPHLSGYEPITAQNAIVKLFDEGKLPAPKEWEILQKSLGSDFTDTLKGTAVDSMTTWQKVKNFAVQVLGAPKALMASFDLSGGGRQGAVLGSRFLPEWGTAQKESVKYFASKDAFERGMQEIASRPNAGTYQKMKLNLASAGAHEEQFASTIAEKIPIAGRAVAASDRAYTGGLTQLRASVADHIIQDLQDAGIDIATLSDKQLQSIGRFINTASGRGNLGALEKHAVSLGEALFSPRLWKSRLDMLNPAYYAKLDPIARKYALQAAGSFSSIAATILSLAAVAGASVETDPRSSDFLKIKVGDTRYDILGGFQQNLVLAWRELKGEKKNSTTGDVSSLTAGKFGAADRLSILADFIQNKENPVISTAQTLIKGKDKTGNDVNPLTEVGKLAVPLNIQDTYKTVKNTGNFAEGVAKSFIPGSVGVGVGTYGVKDIQPTAKQQVYIKQLQDRGASKDQVAATKLFYSTLKATPDRQKVSDEINKALANHNIAKAQQLARDYNKKYAATFRDWSTQYEKFSTDRQLVKDYNAGKITLTPASVRQRLRGIESNPLYSATYGGG